MTTKPLINVGKNGLGDTFVAGVKDALEARELVKISLLPAADDTPQEVADTLQAAIQGVRSPKSLVTRLLSISRLRRKIIEN